MNHGCAEWRGDLGAYVIGALEEDERAAMRRHLTACPPCRADYEDFLPVLDWLTKLKRHLAACRECRADCENSSCRGCPLPHRWLADGTVTGQPWPVTPDASAN